MNWYHYALLFYWAVSGFWLYLEFDDLPQMPSHATAFFLGLSIGWLALPAILIGRALR